MGKVILFEALAIVMMAFALIHPILWIPGFGLLMYSVHLFTKHLAEISNDLKKK